MQPVSCLRPAGRAASRASSRRGWFSGQPGHWKPGRGGGELSPPSSPPRCGVSWGRAGLLALPCNGWAPSWVAGGSPLPAGTHAERRVHVGGGAVTLPSLAWAASPKCFTGKPLRAGSAADATGYLLTVIKSLANGFGRKNSHDDDLSWAPISDLSYEGMCFPDPRAPDPCPSAGEQSRGSSRPVGSWGAGGGW